MTNHFEFYYRTDHSYKKGLFSQAESMHTPWWRHQMETFSALLAICGGNSPVPDEFPTQRPVTRGFDVFFGLCLNKRLSKQWWGWWFETLSHTLWRHRNAVATSVLDMCGPVWTRLKYLALYFANQNWRNVVTLKSHWNFCIEICQNNVNIDINDQSVSKSPTTSVPLLAMVTHCRLLFNKEHSHYGAIVYAGGVKCPWMSYKSDKLMMLS